MKKEDTRKTLDLIDMGTWKHSWHLEKNQYGYVDWGNKANVKECLRIAMQRKIHALGLLDLAGEVEVMLRGKLLALEEQERIDSEPE